MRAIPEVLHYRSFLLGLLLGLVLAGVVAMTIMPEAGGPCWLQVKNTGTRAVQLHALGGKLPLSFGKRFGFLPVPERKEHWGRLLAPGELGGVPYAPGATIYVMEMRGGVAVPHAIWTGTSRTLVGEIDADDPANIAFRVTSESP